ncbi:MAG: hypothetical protein IJY76_01165, partial [Anaerotignum sp.]|nr:hypothetical protein [Anaerotignum sp.]
KRIDKARLAIVGRQNTALWAICLGISLLMIGCLVFASLIDTEEFLADNIVGVFVGGSAFMSFMMIAGSTILPMGKILDRTERLQRNMLKGSVKLTDTFMHLPVKKVSAYKQSFGYFGVLLFFSSVPCIFLNVMVLLDDRFTGVVAGSSAVISTAISAILLMFYLIYSSMLKMKGKGSSYFCTAMIIVFYLIWIGSMSSFMNVIFELAWLQALAGMPALCITAASVLFILLAQKRYVEKKQANAAWDF